MKITKWQVLSEKDVSSSRWYPLFRQTIKINKNKIIDDYYLAKLGNIVMIIPIMPNNTIAMVHQYKHGAGKITIEFPAGRIEKKHSAVSSAKRELLEETGIKCSKLISLGKLIPSPTKDTAKLFGFIAKDCIQTGITNFDENEMIQTKFYSEKEIDQLITSAKINCSDTIALWLKYKLYSAK